MSIHQCPDCGGELTYGGEIAAPGYGKAYDCKACDKPFRVVGSEVQDYSELTGEDLDMPISWVV